MTSCILCQETGIKVSCNCTPESQPHLPIEPVCASNSFRVILQIRYSAETFF